VLATQDIHTDLKQVLDEVAKNVNSVEVRLLAAQLLAQLNAEMGSDSHSSYSTNVYVDFHVNKS
jgi:hypothetical protein